MKTTVTRYLLILLGTLSLGLGILGIFVPGLPTTPFLLLSAALYTKSSPRLNQWLINNPYLGRFIKKYQEKKGMTRAQKVYSLILMWTMIILTVHLVFNLLAAKIILVFVGLIGTVVMGFIIRTVSKD